MCPVLVRIKNPDLVHHTVPCSLHVFFNSFTEGKDLSLHVIRLCVLTLNYLDILHKKDIRTNMPRPRSKTFIWRNDGPEQEYLKNLFLDGTISKDTPWQEVYDTYNSIWPGKLLSSL